MNRFIEASGKTVKDAIQNGLKELGCTLDEVETSVIDMGSPGLFGMFGKPAKVRLTVKEKEDDFRIDMPLLTLDQPSQGAKKQQRTEKKRDAHPAKEEKEIKEEKVEAAVETQEETVEETVSEAKPEKREKLSELLVRNFQREILSLRDVHYRQLSFAF